MRHHRLVLAALAGLSALALTGCGFTPLYSSAGYDRLGGVRVEAGVQRFDYLLQDAVRDFAGPGDSPYVLDLTTSVDSRSSGVSASGIASRESLTGAARYSLKGRGAPISGSVSVTISFDKPRDPYAQLAAASEAEERLATRLAEELMEDVAVALRRREAGLDS